MYHRRCCFQFTYIQLHVFLFKLKSRKQSASQVPGAHKLTKSSPTLPAFTFRPTTFTIVYITKHNTHAEKYTPDLFACNHFPCCL